MSYDDQIASVKREIVMRQARGRQVEVERMEAVLKTIETAAKLDPVLRQIHICACVHSEECIHCDATAMVMEDVLGYVRRAGSPTAESGKMPNLREEAA
jgi:hypothetical protein